MTKILLFLIISILIQDSEKISVESSVSRTKIRIGDYIIYKIKITRDESVRIESPGQGINLGYFEIKDYKIHPHRKEGKSIIEEFEYTISTYDTGEFHIPPYPVAYFEKQNSDSFNFIEAPEQSIYVESIFLNDSVVNAEPRPIKDLVDLEYQNNLLLWSLLVLAGIIIIIVIYIYIKNKSKAEIGTKKERSLLAHEKALAELNKLSGFNSENPDEINQYYTNLSLILRHYLEDRYLISAAEETSDELKLSLKQIQISNNQYDSLIEFFIEADLVKFAKSLPDKTDFEMKFSFTKTFVEETKQLQEITTNE
jgi:hypothetical protein